MFESMVDDGVEPKPAIIESSIDVKHTIEASIDVKISTQASVEEKPIGVLRLHDNEVNIVSFFFSQMIDGKIEMICLVGFVAKRQGRDLLYLWINLV